MSAIKFKIRLKKLDDEITRRHGTTRRLTPNEERTLDGWGDEIVDRIQDAWPVDTGTSRDRWQFTPDIFPGSMGILIENPMFYSSWVTHKGKSVRWYGSTALFETLVPLVWNSVKDKMYASLFREVEISEKKFARFKTPKTQEGFLDLYLPWQNVA